MVRRLPSAGGGILSRLLPRDATCLSRYLLVELLVLGAVSLQGCSLSDPFGSDEAKTPNWKLAPNYLMEYEYIPPGEPATNAQLNSCSVPKPVQYGTAPKSDMCSGHGLCRQWQPMISATPNSTGVLPPAFTFCECDRDWADPECRTPRKSQTVAFLLSLFFGVFGLDLLYLGYTIFAGMKLLTLGGLGFWYILDVIRIGCAPVYASDYRVAPDLPHNVFVLIITSLCLSIGFFLAFASVTSFRSSKRREALLHMSGGEEVAGIMALKKRVRGYGATSGALDAH